MAPRKSGRKSRPEKKTQPAAPERFKDGLYTCPNPFVSDLFDVSRNLIHVAKRFSDIVVSGVDIAAYESDVNELERKRKLRAEQRKTLEAQLEQLTAADRLDRDIIYTQYVQTLEPLKGYARTNAALARSLESIRPLAARGPGKKKEVAEPKK